MLFIEILKLEYKYNDIKWFKNVTRNMGTILFHHQCVNS